MAESDAYYEIQVRVTLTNDVQMDAVLFPLPSHRHDPPVDTLAGFLNQRRGEFFLTRLQDGSQMLLPLDRCAMFEISYQTEEMMRAIDPDIRETQPTSDPNSVASYAPVIITLATNRIVRGDLWFFDFDPHDERNVMAALNREVRYVCVHGERGTYFVRRDSILKVQMQGQAMQGITSKSHPEHVTRTSGLVEIERFNEQEMEAYESPSAASRSGLAPSPPTRPPAPPANPPPPAPQEFPFMPGSGSREVKKPSFQAPPRRPLTPAPEADEKKEEEGPQGVDERFWY
ncbi:hypothetical protein KQI84_00035 [bacterium]|nr:hypothetical protein [bacterium]